MWNVRLPQRLQRVWVLFRLLPAWRRRGWVEAEAQQIHSRHQVHHEVTDPQWACPQLDLPKDPVPLPAFPIAADAPQGSCTYACSVLQRSAVEAA